ncbi:hypothetical protein IT407_01645 [Candidatus Uhrbacteria bacterium]|nr:hypothetical protein [Candidatus Uhrbacteria bacterium]
MPRINCQQSRDFLKSIQANFREYQDILAEYQRTGQRIIEIALNNKKEHLENLVDILKEELQLVSFDAAIEILGNDFLGPVAIFKTWNIRLETKDIPPIPFSKEDLERAKQLNQFLILRIPLTMKEMEEKYKGGNAFQNDDWFKEEDFYTKETSKPGWALVSKEPIPDSTSANYLEQTQVICDYLDSLVFGDVDEMPEIYQDAIIEFEAKKEAVFKDLITSDGREAAKVLSELQISKLTRQSPADVIHDLMVYKQSNGERLLESMYTFTSVRSSDGGLVCVGRFDSDGVDVDSGFPSNTGDSLGVCFSRSL